MNSHIEHQLRLSHKLLEDINTMFKEFSYPFDHASGKISLCNYLVGGLPHAADIEVMYKAKQTFENYLHLFFRLLSRLSQIAENVELAGGLKPWLEPHLREQQHESYHQQTKLTNPPAEFTEHGLLHAYSQNLIEYRLLCHPLHH